MKRIALISLAILLTGCSGSTVKPGKTAGGCTGITLAEWNIIPNTIRAGIINGVAVEAKIQRPSQIKAPMLGFGSTKVTARVPSVVGISEGGNSAYVTVQSPAILSWNGKNIKCRAA